MLVGNFVAGQYVSKTLRMGSPQMQFFVKPGSETDHHYGELMGRALEFYTSEYGRLFARGSSSGRPMMKRWKHTRPGMLFWRRNL